MTTDLLGTPLTRDETDILAIYAGLKSLLERDLAPGVAANLRDALASTGVVVTDLALDFEHLIDLGA